MTTTLGEAAPSSTRSHHQPVALCVAIGVLVTVGWVLYRHYWSDDVYQRLVRGGWFEDHFWAIGLLIALVLGVPYAVVLLVWGRGLARGMAGAAVALACALFIWGWDQVFSSYVWDSGSPSTTSVRIYLWGRLLVVATLVPLAWGLARRSGRAWLLGVAVGPAVAAVLRELELRWSWFGDRVAGAAPGHHWQYEAMVFVAPFVLAALACWAIEARGRRIPEIGLSA